MRIGLHYLPIVSLAALSSGTAWSQPSDSVRTIEEVIVTAQRRNEDITDVPISIAVIDTEDLQNAGVTSVNGIQKLVPAVRFDAAGPNSQPTIRGIGSAIAGPGLSANVATYVDGFYLANPIATNADLSDAVSVQVLKGPQGTLFGRNATGGAILVTTRDPGQEFELDAKVAYESFDTVVGSLYVGGGVTESVAGSLALSYGKGDGFVENIYTGLDDAGSVDRLSGRAKLAFDASERMQFTLIAEAADVDDRSGFALSNYEGYSTGALFPGAIVAEDRKEISTDIQAKTTSRSKAVFLKSEFNLGAYDLISYTGARRDRAENAYDIDASSVPLFSAYWDQNDDTFTQEFNLSSTASDKFEWVIGAFYFYNKSENLDFSPAIGGAPPAHFFDTEVVTDSFALFADGTYNLAENLYLTLGARYSYDKIEEKFYVAPDFAEQGANDSESDVKPRVVVRYQLGEQSSVYASISQGSKSAVYNVNGLSTDVVDPESVTAYEIGLKTTIADWSLDGAAFHYDYEDLQVSSFLGASTRVLNAANATINGVEVHVAGFLTDSVRLDVGAAYLDATYDDFVDAPHYSFSPTQGVVVTPGDASGNRMQRTPELSGNVALTYSTNALGGGLDFGVNVSYQSKTYFGAFEDTHQGAYALVDARAVWTDRRDRWTIALYGKNLTDENYLSTVLENSVSISQLYGQPATYGVEVGYRY